jgi:restriction endonuclease S subunit
MKQLDKKGWKKVHFGDVCRNLNVTVKSPEENGYDKVIGLENIESGNLHISTWNDLAEGTTFTKTFEPGHVLFGKRRAYLKKAAVAEFKGLCSGDILVFEAVTKALNPKLLPFIVSSDRFFEHAIKTSAGSLSPRTKFQDLANFEFSLPPIDQQEKLAELLWAGNIVTINQRKIAKILNTLTSSLFRNYLNSITGVKRIKLSDLVIEKPSYGANSPACSHKKETPRYIRITDIQEDGTLGNDIVGAEIIEEKYILKNLDFLIARTADPGRTFLYRNEFGNCMYAGYLIRFKLNQQLIKPEYLFLYSKTQEFRSWISKMTKKGTVTNINAQEYLSLEVPVPDLVEQNKIIDKLSKLKTQETAYSSFCQSSEELVSLIINKIFGDNDI